MEERSIKPYMFKVIVFDGDGTCWNSKEIAKKVWKQVWNDRGYPEPRDEQIADVLNNVTDTKAGNEALLRETTTGDTGEEINEGLVEAVSQQSVTTYKAFLVKGETTPPLYDGIGEAITNIHNKGITIFLVSDGPTAAISANLGEELTKKIAYYKGNDRELNDQLTKKNPKSLFAKLQAQYQTITGNDLLPKEVLVVGDGLQDYSLASVNGANYCFVEYGFSSTAPLNMPKNSFSVQTPQDIEKVALLEQKSKLDITGDEKTSDKQFFTQLSSRFFDTSNLSEKGVTTDQAQHQFSPSQSGS